MKKLAVEQGRFLKRELQVMNCKFQRNKKLQVLYLNFELKVTISTLKFNLVKNLSRETSNLQVAKVFTS